MTVVVSMLRGVNLVRHNRIKMDALRSLYETLGLHEPQSYIQSGNVVFKTEKRNIVLVTKQIQGAIESEFGFRPAVIARTTAEMREVVARNPFGGRSNIEPSKLLVTFLMSDPGEAAREKVRAIKTNPEELRIEGREMYVYFPNGMGRSKLPFAAIDKALKIPVTARNWNSVLKLLEMAERMET
jgi:uncharacterized protein (DUF1697 family)